MFVYTYFLRASLVNVCPLDIEATETTSEKVCQRIEDDTQALPENNSDGVVDIDSAKAVDIHFTSKDPRFALKRNLIDECKRLGIQYMKEDKSGPFIVKDIWSNVEIFFSKLHVRDQTGPHNSKCFIKDRQKIDRERKGTTAMQRAAALDDSNRRKKKKPKTKATNRKKRLSPQEAMDLFPGSYGLFIAEGDTLRCHCNNKLGKYQVLLRPSFTRPCNKVRNFSRSLFVPFKVTNSVLHLKNRSPKCYEE